RHRAGRSDRPGRAGRAARRPPPRRHRPPLDGAGGRPAGRGDAGAGRRRRPPGLQLRRARGGHRGGPDRRPRAGCGGAWATGGGTVTTPVVDHADAAVVRAGVVTALRRRQRLRTLVVVLAALALSVTLLVATLGLGVAGVPPERSLPAIFGSGDRFDVLVVRDLRLPRAPAAILAGVAVGVAGALCQSTLRNARASPDIP